MSDIAIKFENISKQYRLGLVSTRTLSHDLNRWWQTSVLRKEDPYLKIGETNDRASKGESEYVWALRDINFEVKQGEVLGIIGKNGAGKSTLLKILSRVTTPTTGAIKAKGRIASLLEVGTGFHPELTGRENIYMNGSIMGMTKKEITGKLDEIVEFAGVARYLDTPVKRYSSGMTVRLGFSIAAHLDPEILVVDEVLAVGDAEFQKKAIGKMQDVSQGEGRTVLFVSHNMASIKALCNIGVLLKNGSIVYSGNIEETVNRYMGENYKENSKIYFENLSTALGNDDIRVKSFEVAPITGNEINVESGLRFTLLFYNYKAEIILDTTFELSTAENIVVFHAGKVLTPDKDSKKGFYQVRFDILPFTLNTGKYKMKLIFGENQRYPLFVKEDILCFEIENTLTGQGYNMSTLPGIMKPKFDFAFDFFDESWKM
ncbi:MAG: ATP-binding cassette domain-containing protein [Dysgonamonadaceae bacterium]|jgi:lipopolysaccharide transport system ATP-binding protein|nr:ATP-binding cassette domain-containing protein [Dysgonamonadaceae bacterium]